MQTESLAKITIFWMHGFNHWICRHGPEFYLIMYAFVCQSNLLSWPQQGFPGHGRMNCWMVFCRHSKPDIFRPFWLNVSGSTEAHGGLSSRCTLSSLPLPSYPMFQTNGVFRSHWGSPQIISSATDHLIMSVLKLMVTTGDAIKTMINHGIVTINHL